MTDRAFDRAAARLDRLAARHLGAVVKAHQAIGRWGELARQPVEGDVSDVLGLALEANEAIHKLLFKAQVDVNEHTGESDPVVRLIDFRHPDDAVLAGMNDAMRAGVGVEGEREVVDEAPRVEVVGDATHAVTAHLGGGAVRVAHPHVRAARRGQAGHEDPVGADAPVTVAEATGEVGPHVRLDDDEVVAEAFVLFESQ